MKNRSKPLVAIVEISILMGIIFTACDPPTEAETTGSIEGITYDASTSQPLGGVVVTTAPITSSRVTDTNGGFTIEGVEPGDYSLQATKADYETNSTTVHVIAGETASADMQLTAVSPELAVSVANLDFGLTSTSLPFTISNTGEGALDWSVSENSDWISLNPTNGSISDDEASVTISVDRVGLEPGEYAESITVASNAGSAIVQVSMTVEGPVLVLSNNSLTFGTITDNLIFTITNGGIGTVTYNTVYSAAWLTVNPASGSATTETDVINVSVNRGGLAYGNYFETITVTSNTNSLTVDVMLTVADPSSPQLSAYPSTVDFGSTSTEETLNISNSGTGMLTWNISDDNSWIEVTPQSGTTESEIDEITITVDRLGQSAGTHTGIVTITSDGGNQNITVSMTIPDEPSLSVSPESMDFGSTISQIQFSIVNAGTGELTWTVSDNQEWITTNPASGTNYGTVNVDVSREEMIAGDYSGTVTVSSNGGVRYVELTMNVPVDEAPDAVILNSPTSITYNSMDLDWTVSDVPDFYAYHLYRSGSANVDESSTLLTTITNRYLLTTSDASLSEGAEYFYRLYVEDAEGQTSGSNVVNATTLVEPGTWGVQSTISGFDLYGIDVLSENFAVAVGESGKVYFYDGSIWSEQETMATETLRGVAVISETDIYVVGDEGVFHYNGTIWNQPPGGAPTTICYSIDQVSASDIWIGADNSAVWHFDGTNWTESVLSTSSYISDIQINDAQTGWAVNYISGEVYHYNGVAWSLSADLISFASGIKVFSSTDIWVVRVGGSYPYGIAHWNGSGATYHSNINYDWLAVDGLSPSDVWFLGEYGYIRHWDGDAVTDFISPTSNNLNAVKMITTEDGWAVGDNGVVLRYH